MINLIIKNKIIDFVIDFICSNVYNKFKVINYNFINMLTDPNKIHSIRIEGNLIYRDVRTGVISLKYIELYQIDTIERKNNFYIICYSKSTETYYNNDDAKLAFKLMNDLYPSRCIDLVGNKIFLSGIKANEGFEIKININHISDIILKKAI